MIRVNANNGSDVVIGGVPFPKSISQLSEEDFEKAQERLRQQLVKQPSQVWFCGMTKK